MTILSPNQPWPQVYFRRWDYVYQEYNEGYEDDSIINLIYPVKNKITSKNCDKQPITLFAGPRAARKIEELISRDGFIMIVNQYLSGNQTREFLGMELILTVDDGLWIA